MRHCTNFKIINVDCLKYVLKPQVWGNLMQPLYDIHCFFKTEFNWFVIRICHNALDLAVYRAAECTEPSAQHWWYITM